MKVSLRQQHEAVMMAMAKQRRIAQGIKVGVDGSKASEEYQVGRLNAVAATLSWFIDHEDEIRAFMKLPVESRQKILQIE